MSRPIEPLSPEAIEGLRAFTRDAIRKGTPQLVVPPARQQSLFPTAGLPLFTRKTSQAPEESSAPTDHLQD